jgi:hypothetical protein
MAITKTLHVLLINTYSVTLRKRGKKLIYVYGSPSLFSLGIENRQVLTLLFCIVAWEYLPESYQGTSI